ncbi:MAG: hypothetical protein JSV84_18365 [Gemmatimonadota bacterium]|nr:MAG: hypothetical protein JSV84_18365 [Gemmatimonadota bacterium]
MIFNTESNKGTTLVELLTVLVMMGVLTTCVARYLIVHYRLSNVEQQVGFMQKNLRSAMDIIKKDIMNTGTGIPRGHDLDPIVPGDAHGGGADSIVVAGNFNRKFTQLVEDEKTDNILHIMDASGFTTGCLLYIKDIYGGECHTIAEIIFDTPKEDKIVTEKPLSRSFNKDVTVVSPISRVGYSLNKTDSERPLLIRTVKGADPTVVADNIEDIQFAYVLADGSETSNPNDISSIRMVRIKMTARTERKDSEFHNDGYRRRTLESEVFLRNIGS